MNNINSGFILRRYDSINIGLAVLFAWIPITALTSTILGETYQQTSIFFVLQLIYVGAIFNAIPAIVRGAVKRSMILFVLGFIVMYAISSAFCSDEELKEQAIRCIFLWCLPYFLMSFRIRDYSLLLRTLKYVAFISMICEFLNLLMFASVTNYSQEVGYDALLPFVVFCVLYLKEKKTIYFFFTVISFALILMSGSRGPLFCAILSLASVFIYKNRFNGKTISLVIIATLLYFLYSTYREQILSWLFFQFTNLSVSTRIFELLINNDLSSDSIRDSLRNESFNYALNHPIIGSGFLNDRVYLFKFGFINSKTATVWGSYCHFFFSEILMQFGLLGGLVVIGVFVKNVLTRIKKAINEDEAFIFIIVLTIGLFPLFVSRSWLSFPFFYLIIGMLFSDYSKENNGGFN